MATAELEKFEGRPFSFYPPILNIKHNEWTHKRSTWSEVLVSNTKMDMDIWVPRRFLGDISRVDEPVMIVGLAHELEYRAGGLFPHKRRVVEMPAGRRPLPEPGSHELAPPPRKPSESAAEKKLSRFIIATLLVAVVGTFIAVTLVRGRYSGGRINYQTILQADLGLTNQDDYFAVVRKLGEPDDDHWKAETGERQYRALYYKKLDITVILMGADRDQVYYIGAKDKDWHNVHSVKLPGGGNTDSILRALPRF